MTVSLEDKIREVFADKLPFVGKISDSYDVEELTEDFKGKHWSEIAYDTVERHYDELPLLRDAPKRYFLPAYLLAALRSKGRTVANFLMYDLARQYQPRKGMSLRENQRQAVVEFIRWYRDTVDDSPEVRDTLAYWLE